MAGSTTTHQAGRSLIMMENGWTINRRELGQENTGMFFLLCAQCLVMVEVGLCKSVL